MSEPVIPPKIQNMLDKMMSNFEQVLAAGEEVEPFVFFGQIAERDVHVMPLQFGSEAQKNMLAAAIRQACARVQADFSMFVSEAWSLPSKVKGPGDKDPMEGYSSISEHPDRVEVLTVNVETTQGCWMISREIQPTPDGKARHFVTQAQPVFSPRVEGRFAGFLPTPLASAAATGMH